MKRLVRIATAISIFSFAGALAQAVAADKPVSDADKLQFAQKQVQAQMQELQERMFRLAELTRQSEPDNATRLVLTLRKAREQQILEQMREVLDKLTSGDLSHVTDETQQVLSKLEELKKLLIASDLELQLQLERLRQLQSAIKKLDQAIKAEKQQQAESERLAGLQKKGDQPKPGDLDKAKTDEAANRKGAESIAGAVKSLGSLNSAAASLASAGNSMSAAESKLGAGKPSDAKQDQSDATKKLSDARDQLEQERQRVLQELERQVKRVVIENLEEMIKRQGAIRQATESLGPKLAGHREAVIQLQQLAPAEQRIASICQDTRDLVNETEFSVTLGDALESIQKNMLLVSGDLTGGRGDERVVEQQLAIEQDLKDLLETFKELPNSSPGQSNSQCSGCKGNMNKLLAELKVVRMMQQRINKGTVDADSQARRAAAIADLPPELRDKIGQLRDSQETVRDAMDRLHKRFAE